MWKGLAEVRCSVERRDVSHLRRLAFFCVFPVLTHRANLCRAYGAGVCGGVTSLSESDRVKWCSARGGEQSKEWLCRRKAPVERLALVGLQKPHPLEAKGWGSHLYFCGCRRERLRLLKLFVELPRKKQKRAQQAAPLRLDLGAGDWPTLAPRADARLRWGAIGAGRS